MRVLVTGCAGFIGSHCCERLLALGHEVYGVDHLNDYYDPRLKKANVALLSKHPHFIFEHECVSETAAVRTFRPDAVLHLASMAGVRYSIENPEVYVQTNILATVTLLEACKAHGVNRVVFASSSSVYGDRESDDAAFSESDEAAVCVSPYACSKRCMEVFAQHYSQLYNMDCIGLRFFTVYGPRGRPDMAPMKFLTALASGDTITLFGDGLSMRDYTYIDDIVDGCVLALNSTRSGYRVYNLGNNTPHTLRDFLLTCETVAGKKARVRHTELQTGDVTRTCADISRARDELRYSPRVTLIEGLQKTWEYHFKSDS